MLADDLLMFCRGDPISGTMLFQKFQKFSQASSLEANLDKSNMYLCGVPGLVQTQILDSLHIPVSDFPFRYQGIPLSTKKLSYIQCKPMIEKCQIFMLPKKVIKKIKGYYRLFMWTGDTSSSKKALVSWATLCLPRTAGCWNIRDMYYGTKLLCCPANMSWAMKKIFGCMPLVEGLCGLHTKVPWRRVVCNNAVTPKSLFILWLVMWKRIPTLDMLIKWNIVSSDSCLLCSSDSESGEHFFFGCGFSSQIWQKILDLLHFRRLASYFTTELEWIITCSKKGGDRQKQLVMFFVEALYSIWLNRNDKLYN
ncbi:uncharacterized protein [Spinacia oleracea]|uniref:Reverse transcriptase zinc-binding domain-containing protein n=1 Tax=Spinacia oleracea TaxID=3562 RepID=A0ABM3R4B6_SPIOL|nr:uncharacterized protein LOC130465641 [Spinacia oleracea]